MKSLIAVLGLACGVAGKARSTTMYKWLLPEGTKGGLCMDGSPAGYYYAPAPSASSKLWVIRLQGGGGCASKATCEPRVGTDYGGSEKWTATSEQYGFLAADEESNPDFRDSYKLYVPYCSSDGHSGQRTEADASTFGYYFSGHLNFVNIIQSLLTNSTTGPALKAATQVLLTGGSAGAIGVYGNVDYLQSQLPWAKVKAIPAAGLFFPTHTDDQPAIYPPSDWTHWSKNKTGDMHENNAGQILYNSSANPDCQKKYAGVSWACSIIGNAYPFIKAPVFILQNQFDTNQLNKQLFLPSNHKDPQVRAYVAYYGRSVRSTVTADYLKKGDGAFLPSCFTHVQGLGVTQPSQQTTIPNAPGQTELLGDWFFERNKIKSYYWIDTCSSADGTPCNPTCRGL